MLTPSPDPISESAAALRVMVPKLPSRTFLEPYLDRIDRVQHYTNFGPLNGELEARYAARLGLPDNCVATVGNATLGLTLALAAVGVPRGSLCIMPAWTFIATPLAAMAAGLVPYFVDVDQESWGLDPDTMRAAIAAAPGRVGAIMPVLPFGRPLPVGAWDEVSEREGIPVIIDAAAAVDSLTPIRSISVVSLHATKLLGAGEGGFVASTDAALVSRFRCLSAYGFQGTRMSQLPGTNAKMSEYHAAVGLASLDRWRDMRQDYMNLALAYSEALSASNCARLQPGFGDAWLAGTCIAQLDDEQVDAVAARLTAANIETRQWWERGAHSHPATSHLPRGNLATTDRLSRSTIGLPFHLNLKRADIERVVDVMRMAVS